MAGSRRRGPRRDSSHLSSPLKYSDGDGGLSLLGSGWRRAEDGEEGSRVETHGLRGSLRRPRRPLPHLLTPTLPPLRTLLSRLPPGGDLVGPLSEYPEPVLCRTLCPPRPFRLNPYLRPLSLPDTMGSGVPPLRLTPGSVRTSK